MTPTAARTASQDGSHWYSVVGEPCYEIAKKNGDGTRPTTLADARKLNLLPSVTTILRVLNKPELEKWKIEQACLSLMTAPKLPDEADDAFVFRVLHTEKQQDQEMEQARDLGTQIHAALEAAALGETVEPELWAWILPAWTFVQSLGRVAGAERVVVGQGYAGKIDLLLHPGPEEVLLVDYKTTKRLPDKPWPEARLQLAAYAETQRRHYEMVRCGNLYVSTSEQGKFAWFEHTEIWHTYENGFEPLVTHWQWFTNYKPMQ